MSDDIDNRDYIRLNDIMSGIYPDSTNMGICEMSNIPYNIFLKMWLKILIPMLVVGTAIISVAPYIGLV